MTFAIKADIPDPSAPVLTFTAQKTMYGGKHIAEGDEIFLFASENEGGPGLVACGVVIAAEAVARLPSVARQTPRVSISVRCTARAEKALGRRELKPFMDWQDGRPETELNFKFYRQATDKIVGLSDEAAAYLRTLF
ncbi:hypothetical protein [Nitratireductor pacificus]|uniref:hypothetical protein n=1 Tax=Nitratireductor pacificus TaxID=1231180 RepID=UPI0002D9688B|nr:hypothetical protein [Nitratireductor pacificus]